MNLLKTFLLSLVVVSMGIAAEPATDLREKRQTRAGVIALVRQNDLSSAAALFEARIETGKGRDARDIAIAQEWLGVAVYFFNADDLPAARLALTRAAEATVALWQKKGSAAELFWLYRNLGSLTESILHDRPQALAYYELAVQAGRANAQVPPSEIVRLETKRNKTQEDEAFVKARSLK